MARSTYHSRIKPSALVTVADFFGVTPEEIKAIVALSPEECYRLEWQPKKDGGRRPIHIPIPELQHIQNVALKNRLQRIAVFPTAHGGVPGSSIITNALPHRWSRSMLHLDLADAYGQVEQFPIESCEGLIAIPKGDKREVFENLCVDLFFVRIGRYYRLPQGAPTSPAIFDLACRKLDIKLWEFAQRVGATVSRYCDNITFSWTQETMPQTVINSVKRIITDQHLILNDQKEHPVTAGNCEERPLRLPGVNIIGGELRLNPKMVSRFRGALYNALKVNDLTVAHGVAGHVHQVYGDNPPRQLADLLEQVRQRKKEHQDRH